MLNCFLCKFYKGLSCSPLYYSQHITISAQTMFFQLYHVVSCPQTWIQSDWCPVPLSFLKTFDICHICRCPDSTVNSIIFISSLLENNFVVITWWIYILNWITASRLLWGFSKNMFIRAPGWLRGWASVCLQFRAWFWDPGLSPALGSLRGACFSLCRCLCFSVSLVNK